MDANARFTRCVYEWERKVLRLIGHDFLDGTFKPNAITVIVYVLIFVALTGIFNTIIYYDVPSKLFCLLCLILAIQVRETKIEMNSEICLEVCFTHAVLLISLLHSVSVSFHFMSFGKGFGKLYHVRYASDLVWMITTIQNLYKVHTNTESRTRGKFIHQCAFVTEIVFKFMTSMYILAVFAFFTLPIFVYIVTGDLIPIAPIYIPGIDENSVSGYIALLGIHSSCFFVAVLGFIATEFLLATVIMSTMIFGKLIAADMKLINDDLELDQPNILHARLRLRNVLLMHQEMCE